MTAPSHGPRRTMRGAGSEPDACPPGSGSFVELWRLAPAGDGPLLLLLQPVREQLAAALEAAGLVMTEQIFFQDPVELVALEVRVGIVLMELGTGEPAAMARLRRVASRLAERPWVQVAVSGASDFSLAAAAMEAGATAFLPHGVGPKELLPALLGLEEKARERRRRLESACDLAPSRKALAEKLVALVRELEGLEAALEARAAPGLAGEEGVDDRIALLRTVRFIIDCHATRDRILGAELFGDPSWDILLDLTRAHLAGVSLSASTLGNGGRTPLSTTLRKLDDLVARGLVSRCHDPLDGRRKLLGLTDSGFAGMWQILDAAARAARRLGLPR